MANPIQWTVDQLYSELRKLDVKGRAEMSALNDQKLRLQNLYTEARNANDEPRMAAMRPLISANSSLRLKARDYANRFNALVAQASGLLKSAGLSVPATLSGTEGLGVLPSLLVPAVFVGLVVGLWIAVNNLTKGRNAIETAVGNLPQLLKIAADPTLPADERAAAMTAAKKLLADAGAADDSLGKTLEKLLPIGLVVLAIMVAPTVLKMLPARKRVPA